MNRKILGRLLPSRLPLADYADDIMEAEDFREYVGAHGYHFTCRLAEEASRMLKNADGTNHTWTSEEVKRAIGSDADKHETWWTDGDVCYMANMLYADFVPDVMSEDTAILAARMMKMDKDGYEGMVFMRWLSDLIGRGDIVEWLRFI